MLHKDIVWVEKYRPIDLSTAVYPVKLKNAFSSYIEKQEIPNLIFSGNPGTGKTTIAKILSDSLNLETMLLNASDERGIDVVRTKLNDFVSVSSFLNRRKCIILDEADQLTIDTQAALRGFIEDNKHTTFILTCNYINKIIPALQSRLSLQDFSIDFTEARDLKFKTLAICEEILKKEGVTYTKKAVGELVNLYFPDLRKLINELQSISLSSDNNIIIIEKSSTIYDFITLLQNIKEKDIERIKSWIKSNLNNFNAESIYKEFLDEIKPVVSSKTYTQSIVCAYNYLFRGATVANDLALLAFFVTFCDFVEWKNQ